MIILDTSVLSELAKPKPEPGVIAWLDSFPASELATTAVTAAELWFDIGLLPDGRRKSELAHAVDDMLNDDLHVHAFDVAAAVRYADLVAERTRAGRPITMADAQIAAICFSHGATLATRNTRDFLDAGIALVNPWEQD